MFPESHASAMQATLQRLHRDSETRGSFRCTEFLDVAKEHYFTMARVQVTQCRCCRAASDAHEAAQPEPANRHERQGRRGGSQRLSTRVRVQCPLVGREGRQLVLHDGSNQPSITAECLKAQLRHLRAISRRDFFRTHA